MADRNRLVAEALVDAFLEVADIDGRIATSLAETLQATRRIQPDLILVDAWLDGTTLEPLVRELQECSPGARIYVMASTCDPALEHRATRAGAAGTFEKENVPDAVRSMLATLGVRS